MEDEDRVVKYEDWHLVCPSADPWPAPWGGWSWAGWRWELHPGCTSPQTLWGAAAAETHGAPARFQKEREQSCCFKDAASLKTPLKSHWTAIFNVLPSDNTKPETARSHSGWPCTSSCTPLGLHQSEEENVQILAVMATIISHRICHFRIRPAAATGWWTTGDYTACQTDPCREADPDPCFGRDKHSIFGSLSSVLIQAVATLFNLKSRLSPSDPIKIWHVWPLGCCCGNTVIHPRKGGGRGWVELLWMNEYYYMWYQALCGVSAVITGCSVSTK